jgi:uncharacterized sulfatase
MDDPKSWDTTKYFAPTEAGRQGEGRNLTGGKLPWCRVLAAAGTDEDQPDGQAAAEAIKLIEGTKGKPWFVALGLTKPHDPFVAPKKYFDLFPLDKLTLPTDPPDRSKDLPLAIGGGAFQTAFDAFTDRERREFTQAYNAGVAFMDAQLGKVFAALDRNKLWDNTVVVLWGDHGYHLGERGWWNKNTLFEHSARAPLVAYAPGIKAKGKPCERLVEFVDLYPTLCDLCGVKPPAGLEGDSFRPLLDDPARAWKSAAFTQVRRGKADGRTVRTDRWRYTEWDGGKQGVELYDERADPGEYKNLAADPAHAKAVQEMKAVLAAGWQAARPK